MIYHLNRSTLRDINLNIGVCQCLSNVASVPKTTFISYSCISYFGHSCLKLNIIIIYLLTGKYATQKLKKTYVILVYGHVDILWIIKEPE